MAESFKIITLGFAYIFLLFI